MVASVRLQNYNDRCVGVISRVPHIIRDAMRPPLSVHRFLQNTNLLRPVPIAGWLYNDV